MKQVIVMRTDLNMRKGKMIAQGAHASWMWWLAPGGRQIDVQTSFWFSEGMKKICVGATGDQLLDLYQAAIKANLKAHYVVDAGHTEFHGEPTVTCLAIGPDDDEAVDKITGSLTLL
jgi:PTH2 family peptidyl-tRNA hydrolase